MPTFKGWPLHSISLTGREPVRPTNKMNCQASETMEHRILRFPPPISLLSKQSLPRSCATPKGSPLTSSGYSIWMFAKPSIFPEILSQAHHCVKTVLIVEYSISASLPTQCPRLIVALAAIVLQSFRGEESECNIRCTVSP